MLIDGCTVNLTRQKAGRSACSSAVPVVTSSAEIAVVSGKVKEANVPHSTGLPVGRPPASSAAEAEPTPVKTASAAVRKVMTSVAHGRRREFLKGVAAPGSTMLVLSMSDRNHISGWQPLPRDP